MIIPIILEKVVLFIISVVAGDRHVKEPVPDCFLHTCPLLIYPSPVASPKKGRGDVVAGDRHVKEPVPESFLHTCLLRICPSPVASPKKGRGVVVAGTGTPFGLSLSPSEPVPESFPITATHGGVNHYALA